MCAGSSPYLAWQQQEKLTSAVLAVARHRYRTVARDSFVDEGLFGSNQATSSPKGSPQVGHLVAGRSSVLASSLLKNCTHLACCCAASPPAHRRRAP